MNSRGGTRRGTEEEEEEELENRETWEEGEEKR